MSFSDGKPFVATEHDCRMAWGGVKNGKFFRCNLCGKQFKPGDIVRWQFTNDIPGAGGNPLVCSDCDGPDVIERWAAMHKQWKELGKVFWWFKRRLSNE